MNYNRIEGLDGLRGFAAIAVLLSHAGHYGLNFHPILDFTGIGKHGVFLFFSLSAFLLSFQMLCAKEKLYTHDFLSHFFHRRVFRILPLYLIVILAFWLLGYNHENGTPYFTGGKSVLAAAIMHRAPGVLWAIPPEFKFYFLLPVIIILINAYRSKFLLVVIALLAAILVFRFVFSPKFSSNPLPFFPIFLSGVLAAYLLSDCSEFLKNKKLKGIIAIGGVFSLLSYSFLVPNWVSGWISCELPHNAFHFNFLAFSFFSFFLILSRRRDFLWLGSSNSHF